MTNSASKRMREGVSSSLHLVGSEVALEPLSFEHVDALNLAAADGELWLLHYTSVPTADGMAKMVSAALEKRDEGTELPFAVRRLSDGVIVGSTRYYRISPADRNLSIGFTWYSQSAHRTSVNTECKLLLLGHAFEQLGCISVQWHTHHENRRSQAAIERLGAKLDGILRNDKIMPDGTIRHTYCYSMLNSEWPAAKLKLRRRLDDFNPQ